MLSGVSNAHGPFHTRRAADLTVPAMPQQRIRLFLAVPTAKSNFCRRRGVVPLRYVLLRCANTHSPRNRQSTVDRARDRSPHLLHWDNPSHRRPEPHPGHHQPGFGPPGRKRRRREVPSLRRDHVRPGLRQPLAQRRSVAAAVAIIANRARYTRRPGSHDVGFHLYLWHCLWVRRLWSPHLLGRRLLGQEVAGDVKAREPGRRTEDSAGALGVRLGQGQRLSAGPGTERSKCLAVTGLGRVVDQRLASRGVDCQFPNLSFVFLK